MNRNKTHLLEIFLSGVLLLAAGGCWGVDPRSPVACVSRDGSCFDLKINGVAVVPITSSSKDELNGYKDRFAAPQQADISYTEWETAEPIAGELRFEGQPNYRGSVWFGSEHGLSEPMVFSLDGVKLNYTQSIRSSAPGDPRGAALLHTSLAQKTLPPGNYIFIIGYGGRNNWDRKHVLVRAK